MIASKQVIVCQGYFLKYISRFSRVNSNVIIESAIT